MNVTKADSPGDPSPRRWFSRNRSNLDQPGMPMHLSMVWAGVVAVVFVLAIALTVLTLALQGHR
jgi:hypothetical protein